MPFEKKIMLHILRTN